MNQRVDSGVSNLVDWQWAVRLDSYMKTSAEALKMLVHVNHDPRETQAERLLAPRLHQAIAAECWSVGGSTQRDDSGLVGWALIAWIDRSTFRLQR